MNFPLSLTRFSFHHFPSATITLASYFHFERMSKRGSRKKDDGFSLEYFKRNATGSCKEERMLKSESDGVKKTRIEREGKKMEKKEERIEGQEIWWGSGFVFKFTNWHQHMIYSQEFTTSFQWEERIDERERKKKERKRERNSEGVPFYQSLSFTLWSLFFQTLIFPKRRKSQ